MSPTTHAVGEATQTSWLAFGRSSPVHDSRGHPPDIDIDFSMP